MRSRRRLRIAKPIRQDENILRGGDENVKEAIAYCQTNPPEIKEDFEREERIMEATGMNEPDYKYGGKYRVLSPQERARLGL
jgi:hypothetical protein